VAGIRIDFAMLGNVNPLASGGQGIVYTAPGIKMQYATSMVFKEYKRTVLDRLDVSVLESMPLYLESLQFARGMELLSRAAWPCRLVEQNGVVKGFVMPAIPPEFFLDMLKASGMSRQTGEFQHLLNSDEFLTRRRIAISDSQRYELLGEVAEALAIFHSHRIGVGDLSPKNLLFAVKPASKVFFLDCDAMRFQDQSVLPQLETPGWDVRSANPGEDLGTSFSDTYKLSLLALRLLVGNQETRDPGRLSGSAPREVRELVRAGLSKHPQSRPCPADWINPLKQASAGASTAVRTTTKTAKAGSASKRYFTAREPIAGRASS
jgi:hypothetical protein